MMALSTEENFIDALHVFKYTRPYMDTTLQGNQVSFYNTTVHTCII